MFVNVVGHYFSTVVADKKQLTLANVIARVQPTIERGRWGSSTRTEMGETRTLTT